MALRLIIQTILLVNVLFLPSLSSAATYYIDYNAGDDTKSGLAANTAWKHSPGDSNATAAAAAVTLQPGDIIKFKGGTIYFGSITIRRSGTAALPIIYDGNASGDWGTGRAVIDLNYSAGSILIGYQGVGFITIKGFELRNAGGYADNDPILQTTCAQGAITNPPGGVAVNFFDDDTHDIVLDNLYIHRIGNWRNTEPFSGTNSISGAGIKFQNARNISIRNIELTKTRVGIAINATTATENVEIDRVHIHDYIVWGIDVAPRRVGGVLRNISIHDSIIRDYHQFDLGNWQGCGEKPHSDGIFLRTAAMASTWEQIKIYNNEFYADYPESSQGGTASIYISQGPSVEIFNNTFRGDRHTRSIGIGHSNPSAAKQIVRIYNNSFLQSATPIIMAGEVDPTRREIYIQNNIFSRSSSANSVMVNHDSGVLPVVLNNNLYWDSGFNVTQKYIVYSAGYKKLADVKALGFETTGIYSDPGFISSTLTPSSANNLKLSSVSSARKTGTNLSTFFTIDKAGITRPATGAWDIGAYEYASGNSQAPAAPSGVHITQ